VTDNSNNTNTIHNVYGAVIMARSLREFARFIWWMQIAPTGRQPSDQVNRLGLWVYR